MKKEKIEKETNYPPKAQENKRTRKKEKKMELMANNSHRQRGVGGGETGKRK